MTPRLALGLSILAALASPAAAQQLRGFGETPAPTVSAAAPAQPAFTGPDGAFSAYQRGYYVTAYREALRLLEADPNNAAAMALLGQIYADGLSLKRDETEAARWFRLAAEKGYAPAVFALAMMTLDGRGVEKNAAEARRLLEIAAQKGHGGALYNLGVLSIEGDKPDFTTAADLFRRGAEAGDMDAAYSLGLLYREGRGVGRDPVEAARWIGRAADERHLAAEIEYAIMLFNGDGVARNEPAAAKLFLRAAYRDNPAAQNRIARILAAGRGMPKNLVEAMKWHILARVAGVQDAWLDDQMAALSADQKSKVDEAVRRYLGR